MGPISTQQRAARPSPGPRGGFGLGSERLPGRARPPRGRQVPIRVVLAEHDPDVIEEMRVLLDAEGQGEFEVVAEAGSIPSARRFAHSYRPCVLLLDLDIPTGSSMDAVSVIHAESPQAEIVVLVAENPGATVCAALRAGATGYVLREFAHVALPLAVRCAAEGHGYLVPAY